ncbi:MAG: cytochrome c oxidase subunit II [Dehalococcoidia bacterium]
MRRAQRNLWGRTGGHVGLLAILAATAVLVASCSDSPASRNPPSSLDFQGEGSSIIGQEWWVQFALGSTVFLVVLGLLGFIVFRQLRRPVDLSVDMQEDPRWLNWIWIGGIAVPLVIISVVFAFSVRSMVALGESDEPEVLTVQVVGHRWWWEVIYPEQDFRTANEIRVPVGERVRVEVTSEDVIHSFWVPQVHGKIDMIPGQTLSTVLEANAPGSYRGICAEFCGLQHARMHFMLVAMPPDRFDQWLERERQQASEPQDDLAQRGQDVFLNSTCVYCHQIRGTAASGGVGPDLTHVASRLTLAAGTLENNPGNMAGWIVDPQRIKPGALMPPAELTGEDLQALLAYLRSLE